MVYCAFHGRRAIYLFSLLKRARSAILSFFPMFCLTVSAILRGLEYGAEPATETLETVGRLSRLRRMAAGCLQLERERSSPHVAFF